MNVTTALTKISYALRGIDDDAPTFGSDEANYWLSVLNDKKDELFGDPNQPWSASFKATSPNEPGTVATTGTTTLTGTDTNFTDYRVGDTILVSGETARTIDAITSDTELTVTVAFSNTASSLNFTHTTIIEAGVQSYNLHRSFISPSDSVTVVDSNSQTRYYNFIRPGQRSQSSRGVYISGQNPAVVTFNTTIQAGEDIVGGTLETPGFYLPEDMTLATDVLPFPDPNWGVMATAAEVAFNDIIYEDKAADIQVKANNLMKNMAAVNRKGTFAMPRTVQYNVKSKILDPSNVEN